MHLTWRAVASQHPEQHARGRPNAYPRSQHELSHGKAIAIATRWNDRRFADYYAHPQYPLQIFQLGSENPA